LPETKGIRLEEMEFNLKNGVPLRRLGERPNVAPDGTTLYANKIALENTGLTIRDLTNENLLRRDGLPRQAEAPGELAC